MFSMRVAMAGVYLFGGQITGGSAITPNLHIFSIGQTRLVRMQEALTAAMAVKKLGEAFGLDTKDVFLALPEGMAAELGLPNGTILNVTNLRMDKNNEVILEGTLTGKDLKAEKNFILVGSNSDMAATLGQKNDTKGAQLLLIQEKDGYRAVTYVMDANAKGGVRVLNKPQELLNSGLVRDAVIAAKAVGGFGGEPDILEQVTETAVETTKKAAESIPGAKTILKKMTPESKEAKPARATEKLEEKPSPKSLFDQLLPFFEKNPGSPLPMPRGLNPLRVNGDAMGELYASAKDVLGLSDGEVVSPSSVPEVKEEKPILVANAKMAPNAPVATAETATPAETTPVKETVAVNAKETKPLAVSESKPEPTATKAAPTEKPSALSAFWNATKEKAGNFYDKTKQQVAAYVDDAKTVTNFVKDKTVELCQDAVQTLVETKDKIVDVGQKVADEAHAVKLTVGNFEYGLEKGITGDSPVRLKYNQQTGLFGMDPKDSTYAGYSKFRDVGYSIGDFTHDRFLDGMDMFKANIRLGPGGTCQESCV